MSSEEVPGIVRHRVTTTENRSYVEHVAMEALRRQLRQEVMFTLYFEEIDGLKRKVHLFVDDVMLNRDGELVLIGHTEDDVMYGEYYSFNLSGPAEDVVPVTIYDGSLARQTIESLCADTAWPAVAQVVMGRYTTNRSR